MDCEFISRCVGLIGVNNAIKNQKSAPTYKFLVKISGRCAFPFSGGLISSQLPKLTGPTMTHLAT